MDTITYCAAVRACENAGEWTRALEIFSGMSHQRLERDAMAYNSIISACETAGQWRKAQLLFQSMLLESVEERGGTNPTKTKTG